jgi:hypothetical protein
VHHFIKKQEFLEFPEFLDDFFSNSLKPLAKTEICISERVFFDGEEDS